MSLNQLNRGCRARENPFRSERVGELAYRLIGCTWDELWQRLESQQFRASIVGPHGSGKTTLQSQLADRLVYSGRNVEWVRLRSETTSAEKRAIISGLSSRDPQATLMVDGAEQLGDWHWRHFLHQSRVFGGVIITTHFAGRLPLLLRTSTSVSLLEGIVHDLLTGEPGAEAIDGDELECLFARHRGDIRQCLRELYDHWANI